MDDFRNGKTLPRLNLTHRLPGPRHNLGCGVLAGAIRCTDYEVVEAIEAHPWPRSAFHIGGMGARRRICGKQGHKQEYGV